LDDVFIRV